MIAIRGLAVIAVSGCIAIAVAPHGAANDASACAQPSSSDSACAGADRQLAEVHDIGTGVRADSSRTLAAR